MKHRVRLALVGAAGVAAVTAALFAASPSGAQQELDLCAIIESESEGEEFCGLEVDKDLTSAASVQVGGNVTYTVKVTNTGTVDLTNIGVIDQYDDELSFDSSDPVPSLPPDSGLAIWDAIDTGDDDGPDVLEPGESLTITVEFDAIDDAEEAENCAMAYANVGDGASELAALQVQVSDVETDFNCADVEITSSSTGGGGNNDDRDPSPTPTDEPSAPAPTPIVTVAPATVVPQPTQPAGIVAPDTGAGPGQGGGTGMWLLVALFAGAIAAGAGIAARRVR
jgi:uncharacterized repeat protein (TIGR01451 family)